MVKRHILTGGLAGMLVLSGLGCSVTSPLTFNETFNRDYKLGCTTAGCEQKVINNSEHTRFETDCYCDHDNQGPIVGTIQRAIGKIDSYDEQNQ